MITKAITKAFEKAKERNWNKTFWAFDIHDTIIKPNWSQEQIPTEFYPNAKKALQMISQRTDIVCILYTCSHPDQIDQYLDYFKENGIHFEYVNANPEVISKNYGYFKKKPYFNVLFEDKAGFDAHEDWKEVIEVIRQNQIVSLT